MEKVVIFLIGVVCGYIATRWHYAAKLRTEKDAVRGGGVAPEYSDRSKEQEHSDQQT